MKATGILAALLLMVAGLQTVWAQKVVLHKTNGKTIECEVSELDSITFEQSHEWVDLGLPSGTLWATCNIGANSPEEYGDYFAWGETEPKEIYDWSTYKYCNGSSNTMTKYCTDSDYGYNGFTDGLSVLLPEDDAATVNWGSGWQMPSPGQYDELMDKNNTMKEWTTLNGVYGLMLTSKINNNSLFFPCAGYRENSDLYTTGSRGHYWMSYRYSAYQYAAYFRWFIIRDILDTSFSSRSRGQSVRPVRVK